ncbi:ribosome maturation factor RimP [Paenibacillus chartarius]|uniref:Ribosome maturation factor RimP n=1 Tax=Paenibacillus chartarius TaxID=747481 RepID=A0ABV6DP02_9BACL
MNTATIKPIVEDMLKGYLDEHHIELVDIEYVKEGSNWFLRVYVDKEGGIDIDDCGRVSEYLSAKLDEKDPIPDAYFLEVSSPGAERPLKKPQDYVRAVGQNVFVTTYEPIDGKKEFEGTLEAFDGDTLTVLHSKGKKSTAVPLAKVASARLAIVF